jgi:flagellar biosynthesis protein FliR
MKAFILGTIFGIVLCTVGLSGIAKMFDNGVSKVQQVTKEAAQ